MVVVVYIQVSLSRSDDLNDYHEKKKKKQPECVIFDKPTDTVTFDEETAKGLHQLQE